MVGGSRWGKVAWFSRGPTSRGGSEGCGGRSCWGSPAGGRLRGGGIKPGIWTTGCRCSTRGASANGPVGRSDHVSNELRDVVVGWGTCCCAHGGQERREGLDRKIFWIPSSLGELFSEGGPDVSSISPASLECLDRPDEGLMLLPLGQMRKLLGVCHCEAVRGKPDLVMLGDGGCSVPPASTPGGLGASGAGAGCAARSGSMGSSTFLCRPGGAGPDSILGVRSAPSSVSRASRPVSARGS